jgi:hypothetical protein
MKPIPYIFVSLLSALPLSSHAAPPPPYLSVAEAEHVSFSAANCTATVSSVLRADGFNRVTTQGNIVFAALRSEEDYGFKVAAKCLSQYNMVTITVVSAHSGGLEKARYLVSKLRTYKTTQSNSSEEHDAGMDETVDGIGEKTTNSVINCSSGSNLVRCLDSIPQGSIEIAQEYLNKRLK